MEEDIKITFDSNDGSEIELVLETEPATNLSSDDEESFRTCDNAATENVVNAPPEFSEDSDGSDSENSSDLFLSDNNEYDSEISDPGREISPEEDRNVETSFQRELLDYLGSLFNVNSRIRSRDIRQPVTVSEEQLQEYKSLREKVDKEMKILGVASMTNDSSSDQSIARNLYYLLAARERGDWSSSRQYMRVIPMWTFETNITNDKDESCGDVVSNISSSPASDRSDKMEVDNGINKDEGNAKMEGDLDECTVIGEDEPSLDSRRIRIVTRVGEEGYLNRGAQLWAQESDDVEESKEMMMPIIPDMKKNDQYDTMSSFDIFKDDFKSEIVQKDMDEKVDIEIEDRSMCNLDILKGNVETDNGHKETLESGVFKRSFQSYHSEEIDNNMCQRDVDKTDCDLFTNISKKCKLDMKEDPKSVDSLPILKQVSRVGQRDIKSAIYGSRWSVQRLGLEGRFPVHAGCVNALHFSSNGDWIASGSDDREVVITDWQKNVQVSRFVVGHSSNIFQVRFLPGSNDLELVTCSRDRSVRYAALSSTGQLQYSRVLAKHNDACHKMDMPLDQPCLVISAGEDCRVLWSDVRASKTNGQLCMVDKVPLYSVSCNPVRSQEFCVAGKDNRVYIYDRRKPKKSLNKLCPEDLVDKARSGYHVTSVVYNGDGNSVLASYNDEDIYLMSVRPSVAGPVTLHKYVGHRNVQTVTGVSFYGPNQEYIVSGSNDGHVLLWERDTEALVNWFLADEAGVVNVLQPHPFMPVLATSGLDHDFKLWSMLAADRECPRTMIVDDDLIDRDQETSRIDVAWKTLTDKSHTVTEPITSLPFNLRNLQVITALNWKMRAEAYPYSFDNTLENLIFMSRRHGENQLRSLFISDSDSNESYETVPNIVEESVAGVTVSDSADNTNDDVTAPPIGDTNNDESGDRNRPDGCRSS